MTGVAWYRQEEWPLLLACCEDGNTLERTYEEWLRLARAQLYRLRGMGVTAVMVDVPVAELVEWCRLKECTVNGNSRAAFVAEKLQSQQRG